MTSEQFVYWLHGYFELRGTEVGLSDAQVDIIKDHLDLVLTKVTPNRLVEDKKKSIYDQINPCGSLVGPAPDPNVRSYCVAGTV